MAISDSLQRLPKEKFVQTVVDMQTYARTSDEEPPESDFPDIPNDFQKEMVRKGRLIFEEGWSKGRIEVVDEVLAKQFVRHDPNNPDVGPEEYKADIMKYRTAFPDLTVHIHEMIAWRNHIWTRLTATGTHKGEFNGIKPTGAKIAMVGFMTGRFNKYLYGIEGFSCTDYLGVVRVLIKAMSWWQFLLNIPAIIKQSGLGRDPETPVGEAGYKGWRALLNIKSK